MPSCAALRRSALALRTVERAIATQALCPLRRHSRKAAREGEHAVMSAVAAVRSEITTGAHRYTRSRSSTEPTAHGLGDLCNHSAEASRSSGRYFLHLHVNHAQGKTLTIKLCSPRRIFSALGRAPGVTLRIFERRTRKFDGMCRRSHDTASTLVGRNLNVSTVTLSAHPGYSVICTCSSSKDSVSR